MTAAGLSLFALAFALYFLCLLATAGSFQPFRRFVLVEIVVVHHLDLPLFCLFLLTIATVVADGFLRLSVALGLFLTLDRFVLIGVESVLYHDVLSLIDLPFLI